MNRNSRICVPLAGILVLAILAKGALAAVNPAAPDKAAAQTSANSASVARLMSEAQQALKNQDARRALILIKNAAGADPRNWSVRAQLASVLLGMGDATAAETELRYDRSSGAPDQIILPLLYQALLALHKEQMLLDEFPDPNANTKGDAAADLLKARAMANLALGNANDAAAAMDRSLSARHDISGMLVRARIAQQQDNIALAKSLDDEALGIDPNNVGALMFKLGLQMLAGDIRGALALNDRIRQLYPNDLAPRVARVELYLRLQDDQKAKMEVSSLLAKLPDAPIGAYYRAVLLARAHNVGEAWHVAQSLPPEFTQSQAFFAIMVAQIAIGSGNAQIGADILAATIAKFPEQTEPRVLLAAIRLRQNSANAALAALRPVRDSSDPRVLALLSRTYLKLGDTSSALEVLGKLNAGNSAGPDFKRQYALVEMQAGQSGQGLKDLLELAKQHPTDPEVAAPLVAALAGARRFSEALAVADRLGSDPKRRAQSYFFRGQVLVLKGDSVGALAAFQNSLLLDRGDVASLYYRSGIFEALHRYSEAKQDLQVILKSDPKNIPVLVKMAEIDAGLGHDSDVRAGLARAIILAPWAASPRAALVQYLMTRDDNKAALVAATEFQRVLSKNPDSMMLLGAVQLKSGEPRAAVETFKRLVEFQPRLANARLLLADAFVANNDRRGAAAALNAAVGAEPGSADIRAAQINLMFVSGDASGAVAAAKKYQAANQTVVGTLLLSDTLARANQRDQALDLLQQSFAAQPDRIVFLRLVQLTIQSGGLNKAESLISARLTADPQDVEARMQYATVFLEEGNNTRAIAQYELVLRQDPNNIIALNNLAGLLQESDPKRALSLITAAYGLAPDSPQVADSLGWLKLHQNDAKTALDLLSRAHRQQPQDGEITYHLVMALDAGGSRDKAKKMLGSLLDNPAKFADLPKAQQLASAWR